MKDEIRISTYVENEPKKTLKLFCNECKTETYHVAKTNVRYSWWNDLANIDGKIDNYTVECQGCKSISFCTEEYFSETTNYIDGNPVLEKTQYPETLYSIRVGLADVEDLPELVEKVYKETHKALSGKLHVLAGVGVRAILETVCKDKKADGRILKAKIDDLASKGFITKSGSEILHQLRLIGNKAAHEIDSLSTEELKAALDVVDHLLQGVYIIPMRAEILPKKT